MANRMIIMQTTTDYNPESLVIWRYRH